MTLTTSRRFKLYRFFLVRKTARLSRTAPNYSYPLFVQDPSASWVHVVRQSVFSAIGDSASTSRSEHAGRSIMHNNRSATIRMMSAGYAHWQAPN